MVLLRSGVLPMPQLHRLEGALKGDKVHAHGSLGVFGGFGVLVAHAQAKPKEPQLRHCA